MKVYDASGQLMKRGKLQDRRKESPVAAQKVEQGIQKKGLGDWVPSKEELRKQTANRVKLKETEKIVLGGMDRAKGWDKVKVEEMKSDKIADMLKQMNEAIKKGKLPGKEKSKFDSTPEKAPRPTRRPAK
jgi:hypothetical protein